MDTSAYDSYLTDLDREVIAAGGFGREGSPGSRPALLVVDVTVAFCGDRPEPILDSMVRFRNSSGQSAWDAVAVIERLIAAARAGGVPVIYTRGTTGGASGPGRWAAKNRRAHEDTEDVHEIVPPIAPEAGDTVLRKTKPSAFFGTPLLSRLVELGTDSLVVCGGTTSGCVRATVVDAFSYNFPVAVVSDGCFDRVTASGDIALLDMDLKYADVVAAERGAALLSPPAPAQPGTRPTPT
ncbi:isochorismatase family protein [Streptomyces sp. NPDC050560]|uniref:isochorismatase family protein n=1 Tax=Streptomyces sp. NPDC050560 TaxID=3365630 RepID=UPI003796762E